MGVDLVRRRKSYRNTSAVIAERCEPRLLLAASMVADLFTGPVSSSPANITDVNGKAFFTAYSPDAGSELMKSDGTPGGVTLVKDITPGPAGTIYRSLVSVNGKLFFYTPTGDGSTGITRLWTSDGTDAGTVLVADSLRIGGLAPHQGLVYFYRDGDDGAGRELWRSDGTAAGTYLVKDINAGPNDSLPNTFISVGDKLFFLANDGVHGQELWQTDGTAAGTTLVSDVNPGSVGSTLGGFAAAGGLLYFVQTDRTVYQRLWRTDGTPAGTRQIFTSDSGYLDLAPVGDRMFFTTFQSTRDAVWRTDGTAQGTVALHDFNATTGRPYSPTALGESLYFLVFKTGLYELWKSDGTSAGTVRVDVLPTPGPSEFPSPMKRIGNRLFLTPSGGGVGRTLWSTDGSPGGARFVANVTPGVGTADPLYLVDVGGVAFFSAQTPDAGRELWRSDGTAAGTYMVQDIYPATEGSLPHDLVDFDGTLFFTTEQNDTSSLILKTNPFGDGVISVTGPDTLGGSFFGPGARQLEPSGNTLYFATVAQHISPSSYLSGTTGTPEGSFDVPTVAGGVDWVVDLDHAGTVLFAASNRANFSLGKELWRSDGTAAGTHLVKDINTTVPGPSIPGSSRPSFLTNLNGTVLFSADDGASGRELWRTDGTADGTLRVKDIVPGATGSNPRDFVVVGRLLFFRATGEGGTAELWKSDGTEAGTMRVAAVGEPPSWTPDDGPMGADLGGVLVFIGAGADGDAELWRSDGTEAGTFRVKDIRAGGAWSRPQWFETYGGKVYFSADDGAVGRELWATDGTEAGTARVADLWPGAAGSAPAWLTASGGTLWFAADSATSGRELWKFTPDGPGNVTVTGRRLFYNNSAFDGGDAAANVGDLAAVAADKEALLPGPSQPRFSNVTSYDKGINGLLLQFFGPDRHPQLSADDLEFRVGAGGDPSQWRPAPTPSAVAVIPVPGPNSLYAITWPDGAIRNTWLQVTVKANDHTGLSAPDVFYFGNLVGETGDAAGDGEMRVTALDLAAAKRALNVRSGVTTPTDFNRDGRTNALDLATVRRSLGRSLPLFMAPAQAGQLSHTYRVADEVLSPVS